MIAAGDAEDHAPIAEDVGHRIIFRQAQRMPHRHDVEGAADLEVLGDVDEVHRHHQEVGDAFRAFGLEMVLGHPEGVVAEPVHALGVVHRLVQHAGQFLVRIPAVVDWRAGVARVLQIDRADVGTVEFCDHRAPHSAASALRCTRQDFMAT